MLRGFSREYELALGTDDKSKGSGGDVVGSRRRQKTAVVIQVDVAFEVDNAVVEEEHVYLDTHLSRWGKKC
jgi:hypothetical protein